MVEVIHLHPYNESYPFGLQKPTEFTYVELIKQHLSREQLQTYKHNLNLFKLIESSLIIPMDSYLQQDNRLLIYYHYEPVSIKAFIQQQLNQYRENEKERDIFLAQIINIINSAIEGVIVLLASNNLQAYLSINNLSIATQNYHIRFFIDPDFDYVQTKNPSYIREYYSTERKKLQIQLQEFFQHVLQITKIKPTQVKKANFIIQGTKLVFINDQFSNRKSSVSKIEPLTKNIKNKQKSATLSSQTSSQNNSKNSIKDHQNSNNSKHKFDIKNILDQKKLQKNQILTIINNHHNIQKQQTGNIDNKKQVKNYFQNNDDFKKDASFYPQQFVKDDSIAQFEGYEDQLEKQLEDLKKKKEYKEDNPYSKAQKMTKFQGLNEASTTQSKTDEPQPKQLKFLSCSRKDLRSPVNLNQQNDQSNEKKQKKKYQVIITTSHEVNVQDGQNVDLNQIQKQVVEDIKNGWLRNNEINNEPNLKAHEKVKFDKQKFLLNYNSPNHIIKGRETHNPSSSHEIFTNQIDLQQRNTSLNSIGSNMSTSVDQKFHDEKPFTKHHHLDTEIQHHFQSGKDINVENSAEALVQHNHDIQRILEKVKKNILNQQNPLRSHQNQPERQSIGISNTSIKLKQLSTQQPIQLQNQLSSHLLNEQMTQIQNRPQQQLEREYLDKIQKAKLRAQQIMKLAKQRRVH